MVSWNLTTIRTSALSRLVTLTDGVFAIVMTILVLDLEIPGASADQSVSESIRELGATFSAFVISFLLVGMYWVWHRGVFAQVRHADYQLVWLNLFFLLPVSMIPFAASTLGSHFPRCDGSPALRGGTGRSHRDAVLAELVSPPPHMVAMAGSVREGSADVDAAAAAPLVLYTIAILIAGPAPVLSVLLYLAVPAVYAGVVLFLKSDKKTSSAAQDIS